MNLSLLKYVGLKTSDLTPVIVRDIAKALGHEFDPDEPTFGAIVGMLKDNNIHDLAEVLGKPEMIERFAKFLKPNMGEGDTNLVICPHCGGYISQ